MHAVSGVKHAARNSEKPMPAVRKNSRRETSFMEDKILSQGSASVAPPQTNGSEFNRKERMERKEWICFSALFAMLFLKVMFSCVHFHAASLVSCSMSAWDAARKAVMMVRPFLVTL